MGGLPVGEEGTLPQNGKPVFPVDRCKPAGFHRPTGQTLAGRDDRLTVLGRPGSTVFFSVDRRAGRPPGRPRPVDRPAERRSTGWPADLPGRLPGPVDRIHFFLSSVCGPLAPIHAKTLDIGLRWGPRGVRFLISDVPLQVQGCLAQKKHLPSYLGPYIITSLIRKRPPP